MVVWSGKKVAQFVKTPPEVKINPNGVDIGVSEIWRFHEQSETTINKDIRKVNPEKAMVTPDEDGYYKLPMGVYEIRIANEISINLGAHVSYTGLIWHEITT